MSEPRTGAALVLAVFVLMALGTTSLGLLYVSSQETLIARGGEEATRARWAAESAVRATLADWSTRRFHSLAPGDAADVDAGEADVRVSVERLDGSLFLITATAVGGGARSSAAALARAVLPDDLWPGFEAALTAREHPVLDPGAVVTADDVGWAPQPWSGEACPEEAAHSMVRALGSLERPALLVEGDDERDDPSGWRPVLQPDAMHHEDEGRARIGPFAVEGLHALADRIETGDVWPAPHQVGDECDFAAAANWGAPLDSAGPCGDYFPLIFAPGGLHVTGGAGQGILVVDGDLVLSGDARFYGAVHVTGALILRDQAVVLGAVSMAGGAPAQIEGEARIDYRACALWRAFSSAPALDQAFAPAGRAWVPAW